MSEDGAHQQSHQAGRGFLSLPGMWGFNGGLLQLSCSLAPHESPVSSFTRPSFLIHRHWLNEQPALLGGQGRKFFSFHPGSAGRLFPDPHLRQNPEGSAEEGRFRTANLLRRVPSQVGHGLWPVACGLGQGGAGAAASPCPHLLSVQPAEAGGCREQASACLCWPLTAVSAAPWAALSGRQGPWHGLRPHHHIRGHVRTFQKHCWGEAPSAESADPRAASPSSPMLPQQGAPGQASLQRGELT